MSSVQFSPDGDKILFGSQDKSVRIWDNDWWVILCANTGGAQEYRDLGTVQSQMYPTTSYSQALRNRT